MDIVSIITNPMVALGIGGAIGGAWRAADWWLNHREHDEEVEVVLVSRNLIIGIFFGTNTGVLNDFVKSIIGYELPTNPIIAFMYGMCAELMIVSVYDSIKNKFGPTIDTQIKGLIK